MLLMTQHLGSRYNFRAPDDVLNLCCVHNTSAWEGQSGWSELVSSTSQLTS